MSFNSKTCRSEILLTRFSCWVFQESKKYSAKK